MSEMRQRMIADDELGDDLFEEYAHRIALEAHEDRLKLWETVVMRDEHIQRLEKAIANPGDQQYSVAVCRALASFWSRWADLQERSQPSGGSEHG